MCVFFKRKRKKMRTSTKIVGGLGGLFVLQAYLQRRLAIKEGVDVANPVAYLEWIQRRLKEPGALKDIWLQRAQEKSKPFQYFYVPPA